MKRAWAVLLAAVLGACSGDVERPGPTGPAGPKLDTRVVRVLSPRPGEVLSVDAVVREPGLVVVADVSRLAEGGAGVCRWMRSGESRGGGWWRMCRGWRRAGRSGSRWRRTLGRRRSSSGT